MAPKHAMSGTDPYALLKLPCRFHLDSSVIEEAFRRAAALHHPDQTSGSTTSFHQLQEAATILRNPAKRLRHFAGASEPRSLQLPSAAAELFPSIMKTLQQADHLIKKYQNSSGNLTKALMKRELLEEQNTIQNTLQQIETWHESLQQQLRNFDASETIPSSEELLELANQFTFVQRWEQQLRECEFTLTTLI